ncbi:biotin/lipoyl-binding protein [Romboutsia maritimum]|uniref:Biotin/lipoyl-binding protein n=1 Tax=Romboutsia maritimum TaxID=2020948 RepID=A0A371IQD4_9FIRM|nr:biotin/lipoyl-binding protein [Romboutsia maritimum]
MKNYNITVNGTTYEVEVEETGSVSTQERVQPQMATQVRPQQVAAKPQVKSASQGGSGSVVAPMPGTISDVRVSVGQSVKKGDILLILEAMKMENEIMAPHDGKVSAISVSKGSSVSSGDALVTLG